MTIIPQAFARPSNIAADIAHHIANGVPEADGVAMIEKAIRDAETAAIERAACAVSALVTEELFRAETGPEDSVPLASARADAFSEAAEAIRSLSPAASFWRPMSEAPKDGTPILAKIKDGLTIPVDGVEQPFWWSGKCAVVSPVVTGEPRWELHALDSWWCFGEHEIEGWMPLPGGETTAPEKGGAL